MICSAFDFLKIVIKFGLISCILISMDFFECLVFLEHVDVQSEFINKGCGSMLDDVIGGDQDVEGLVWLFNVVVKDP